MAYVDFNHLLLEGKVWRYFDFNGWVVHCESREDMPIS